MDSLKPNNKVSQVSMYFKPFTGLIACMFRLYSWISQF